MKAFLTGLGIGVGLGVLLAPDAGEATRKKVRDRLDKWSETFSQGVETVKTAGERAGAAVSDTASDATEKLSENLPSKKEPGSDTGSSAGSDAINTLSREELLAVNGIGPVLADKLISNRPYSSRRELVERGILPLSTFEELERELRARDRRSA
jgi:gas vesicle protein